MPEMPPFSPTVTLLALSRIWEDSLTSALKPLGLTTRKYALLGHIRSTPGISFSDLARRSRITVQSTHVAVGGFVADGIVADSTGRAGSAAQLEITPAGHRLLAEAAGVVARLDADFETSHPALRAALADHMLQMMQSPGLRE
ncbi:MarR family transcriptional regulator [Plantibacter sp. PA-3-X8]|uniref:MarR family winged helix-turn-helix transcriptional regulator n=2 Tax=Microbacteriaceae TaxID=85023 RepID=UPI000F5E7A7E|nr:MarR family winged helix-turn-helix transcriptional regulator [Plantibacter sp. PA-3-X8]AZH84578.1 MarR family transcriptional regulator [Plantibacter sp. PA-3-X8]